MTDWLDLVGFGFWWVWFVCWVIRCEVGIAFLKLDWATLDELTLVCLRPRSGKVCLELGSKSFGSVGLGLVCFDLIRLV